jgi:GDP-4-dehydro-6-deoxy-D-mannose reductase
VCADITDKSSVDSALHLVQPNAIVHLAARASGADSDSSGVFSTNVGGSRNVLQSASSLSNCSRVVMVSSGYVYGSSAPDHPSKETDALATPGKFGCYTDSKAAMEELCANFSGIAIVARPFSHTGPGQVPSFAIPGFAKQIAEIEAGVLAPVVHVGNLEALRDMLHVKDVVRAYSALLKAGVPGETYNVSTGKPVSVRSMLEVLCTRSTVHVRIEQDPARLRPADIACSSGSPQKIRDTVGWRAHSSTEDALVDTLSYWREVVSSHG